MSLKCRTVGLHELFFGIGIRVVIRWVRFVQSGLADRNIISVKRTEPNYVSVGSVNSLGFGLSGIHDSRHRYKFLKTRNKKICRTNRKNSKNKIFVRFSAPKLKKGSIFSFRTERKSNRMNQKTTLIGIFKCGDLTCFCMVRMISPA